MSWGLFRLSVLGARRAVGRLVFIAAGAAVGTALLLLLLGAHRGLGARDDRAGWLLLPSSARPADIVGGSVADPGSGQVLLMTATDHVAGRSISRVELSSAQDRPLSLPDGSPAPGPGTYRASPALASLVATTPGDELGRRWGRLVGLLGPELLVGPDDLVVVAGRTTDDLAAAGQDLSVVEEFNTTPASRGSEFRALILVGSVAVLFPVVLFINIVTQLGGSARQDRDATLRTIGATPSVVRRMAMVEFALATGVGALLGVAVSVVLRPVAARVKVSGDRFYPGDLALPWPVVTLVAAGVLLLSVATAAWRLRRAELGNLGPDRSQREGRPRWWRTLPLVVGLAAVAGCATLGLGDPWVIPLSTIGLLVGVMGVVAIGPWLTAALARLVGARASSAEGLMAASRIAAYPKATFRSVSGLVVALFMSSVLGGLAAPVRDVTDRAAEPGALPADAVVADLATTANGRHPRSLPPSLEADLEGIPGVRSVTVLQRPLTGPEDPESQQWLITPEGARAIGFDVVPDSAVLAFRWFDYLNAQAYGGPNDAGLGPAPAGATDKAVPAAVIVRTDGTSPAVERARTALELVLGPSAMPPFTASDRARDELVSFTELQTLADLGVLVSMAIAACSLAVATAAAVLDRRRSIGLLRLTGMSLRRFGLMVAYETMVPLVAVSMLASLAGFGFALLLLDILSAFDPVWPDGRYLLVVGSGWLMTATGAASSILLIRRHTATAATRFE